MEKALTFVDLKRIPGPRSVPYFRYVRFFQRDVLGAFTKVFHDYGDIGSFPWPMNSVIIYSPEFVRKVLIEDGRRYIKGEQLEELRAVVGDGLATNNDHKSWLKSRSLISREFGPKAVAEFTASFESICQEHLSSWADQQEFDVCERMKFLAFQIACRTLLKASLGPEDAAAVSEAVHFTSHTASDRIFQFFPLPYALPTKKHREFDRHFKAMDRIVRGLIQDERKRAQPSGSSVLERLVHAVDDETGTGLSDDELRDEVLTMLLAGHETSAHSLTWALALLAQHPEIQEKLFLSLSQAPGDNSYLRQVLLESMRLYPAFPVLSRKVAETVTLGPYTIPKNTNVVIPIYVIHRRGDIWSAPLSFIPERFSDPEAETRFSFLPFSKGTRKCVAELFAMTEMMVIVRQIVLGYKLELTGGFPADQASVTLKPQTPVMVRVRKR